MVRNETWSDFCSSNYLELATYCAMRTTGNWRLIFRFEDGDAFDVDLVDYH